MMLLVSHVFLLQYQLQTWNQIFNQSHKLPTVHSCQQKGLLTQPFVKFGMETRYPVKLRGILLGRHRYHRRMMGSLLVAGPQFTVTLQLLRMELIRDRRRCLVMHIMALGTQQPWTLVLLFLVSIFCCLYSFS